MDVNGIPLTVQRHLVVATRVNPKASYPQTRRIQLRVWNSRDDPTRTMFPTGAAADVAAAHLFGFFRTLHLRENARALALSTRARNIGRYGGDPNFDELEKVLDLAAEELREHTRTRKQEGAKETTVIFFETDFGAIEVEIAAPTMGLARELQHSQSHDKAQAALREAESELDKWSTTTITRPQEPERVSLSFGVRLLLPRDLTRL